MRGKWRYPRCNHCGKPHSVQVMADGSWIEPDLPTCCGEQVPNPSHVASRSGTIFMDDIKPFESPIDGKLITSRSQKREMMKRHNLTEVGNERMKTEKKELPGLSLQEKQYIYSQLK